AYGSVYGDISLVDTKNYRITQSLSNNQTNLSDIQTACFSSDGSFLYFIAFNGKTNKKMLEKYSISQNQVAQTYPNITINLPKFSADGRYFIGCSYNPSGNGYSQAYLWDLQENKRIRSFSEAEGLAGAAVSPDGRFVATSNEEKQVHIWDAATGNLVKMLPYQSQYKSANNYIGVDLTYSPDGKYLFVAPQDTVKNKSESTVHTSVYDTERYRRQYDFYGYVKAFSKNGRYFFPYSMESSENTLPDFINQNELLGVLFGQGSAIDETSSGKAVAHIKLGKGNIGGVSFSPDDRYIAIGSSTYVSVWGIPYKNS
ncbi:MAG: hypothetical protein ABF449_14710, partial [Ethanoligenens sp.]